jgi:transposase
VVHRQHLGASQPLGRRSGKEGDPGEPEHHALGLSRGGIGTKIHLLNDSSGLPLAFTLTPGQRHEVTAFGPTLEAVRLPGLRGRPRTRPKHLAGEMACSYRSVFAYLRRRSIRPVNPPRRGGNMGQGCPRKFDLERYRRRSAIERCVGLLKGCRSIATRHEKLAVTLAAMVQLAFLLQYLRTLRP